MAKSKSGFIVVRNEKIEGYFSTFPEARDSSMGMDEIMEIVAIHSVSGAVTIAKKPLSDVFDV